MYMLKGEVPPDSKFVRESSHYNTEKETTNLSLQELRFDNYGCVHIFFSLSIYGITPQKWHPAYFIVQNWMSESTSIRTFNNSHSGISKELEDAKPLHAFVITLHQCKGGLKPVRLYETQI